MSTSVLKALPGKPDIKRHSPSILYVSKSTTVLGKFDIKVKPILLFYIEYSCIIEFFNELLGKRDEFRRSMEHFYPFSQRV